MIRRLELGLATMVVGWKMAALWKKVLLCFVVAVAGVPLIVAGDFFIGMTEPQTELRYLAIAIRGIGGMMVVMGGLAAVRMPWRAWKRRRDLPIGVSDRPPSRVNNAQETNP